MATSAEVHIPDGNLKLAIVTALVDARLMRIPPVGELAKQHPPDPVDLELDDPDAEPSEDDLAYTYNRPLAQYLYERPVTRDQLAGLRAIEMTAGSELASALFPQWDGEDDLFDVGDLIGLEHCTNLERLSVAGGERLTSLAPIASLGTLRELDVRGEFTAIDAIAGLTSLRELRLQGPVADLAALVGHAALARLTLRWITAPDLAPLLTCTALEHLEVSWDGRVATDKLTRIWRSNEQTIAQLHARKGLAAEITRPPNVEEPPPKPVVFTNPELEAAIDANPDDAVAYHAYGRWLDAQGDVRGKLVPIVQAKAHKAYLHRFEWQLLGALAGKGAEAMEATLSWRHGFLHEAEITVFNELERFRAFLGLGVARFLQRLTLWLPADKGQATTDNPAALAALAEGGFAPSLRALGLKSYCVKHQDPTYKHGLGDASRLWAAFPRLTELTLWGPATLGALELPELLRFEVASPRHLADMLPAISRAHWPKLESLVLYGCADQGRQHDDPPLRLSQFAEVLSGENVPRVRHLAIAKIEFGNSLIPALAQSRILPQLATLDLAGDELSATGVRALIDAKQAFAHLAKIELRGCVENQRDQRMVTQALPNATFADSH